MDSIKEIDFLEFEKMRLKQDLINSLFPNGINYTITNKITGEVKEQNGKASMFYSDIDIRLKRREIPEN